MVSIQGIYLAFFGRPADPLGLAYWEEQTGGGANLAVMVEALSGTDEYQQRFAGMNEEEVISSVYQSLFAREPDAEGLAFFLAALESGAQSLGSIALNILDGAQGGDAVIIDNKVVAADAFTAALDTPEKIAAYAGDAAADFGRQFLQEVTADPATIPTPDMIDERIDADLPNYDPGEGSGPGNPGGPGGGDPDPETPLDRDALLAWQAEQNEAYQASLPLGQYIDVNNDGVMLANAYVAYLNEGNPAIVDVVHAEEGVRAQTFHDNVLGHLLDAHFVQGAERPVDDLRTEAAKIFGNRPWESGVIADASNADEGWDLLYLGTDIRPDLVPATEMITGEGNQLDNGLVWQADRRAPADINFSAEGSVAFSVDGEGPTGFTDFGRYQGVKLAHGNGDYLDLEPGTIFTATLHIEPEWEDDGGERQLSGIWIQQQNEDGTLAQGGHFSIVEYLDADAAIALGVANDGFTQGFRFWNSDNGWSEYLNYEDDGEAELAFGFFGASQVWFLNGEEVYRYSGASTAAVDVLETVTFNSQNFGHDQTYTYSNIGFTGFPENGLV
jgi:hypothetical protein